MTKPKFITFEGGEGSGKTTQSRMLYEYLKNKGLPVLWTREIGGTKEAELIRDIILTNDLLEMTELLLIMAARLEHIEKVIKPALIEGKWVICDRFIDSTCCYQESVGIETVLRLHNEIFKNFMPDLTFFVNLPPDVALARAIARGDSNKFESKPLVFHKAVYESFKRLALKFPERIQEIDGSGEAKDVLGSIIALTERLAM